MQEESISLAFVARTVAFAFALLVGANVILFWMIYGDSLTPLTLPYNENFDNVQRLDYRQFGGQWRLQESALVQHDRQDTDLFAVIPLAMAQAQTYEYSARIRILEGPKGGGLLFNLQDPKSRRQSQLVRFGSDERGDYLVYGYFDDEQNFVGQGLIQPLEIAEENTLAVFVYENSYDVVVNGQPRQRDIPLLFNGGHVALTTWFSSVAFDDVYIRELDRSSAGTVADTVATPLEAPPATVAVAPPAPIQSQVAVVQPAVAPVADNRFFTEEFLADTDQKLWTPVTGDWRFEAGALVQQNPTGYDYTIVRNGTFSRFALSVQFRHRQGIGGGVFFNLPDNKTTMNGHMVRYVEEDRIAWGYFDSNKNFIGQGDAQVASAGDQMHTVQVIVGDTAYSILVDNRRVVEQVPLVSTQGYIGLTTSNSIVAFEGIVITTIQ